MQRISEYVQVLRVHLENNIKMCLKIFSLFIIIYYLSVSEAEGGLSFSLRTAEITDEDLQQLSEILIAKDVPNQGGQISLNLQSKVYANVDSANHLLQYRRNSGASEPATYNLLRQLFQAYDTNSRDLDRLKNDFLNEAVRSEVMKEVIKFINYHGDRMNSADLKQFLDTIWFTQYHRGQGIQSSGFQHVFMAETKNNNVLGLHNWLYYLREQNKGTLNYIGYSKSLQFRGYPSSIIKIKFEWQNNLKPAGSLFVGTSPELEMALYSICFMYRRQTDCNVKLGSISVNIKTHTFNVRDKKVIGSAYPTV